MPTTTKSTKEAKVEKEPIGNVIKVGWWGGTHLTPGQILERVDFDKDIESVKRLVGTSDRILEIEIIEND